jgi:hypothetical protein
VRRSPQAWQQHTLPQLQQQQLLAMHMSCGALPHPATQERYGPLLTSHNMHSTA